MRELKVGESYTGDELLEILGATYDDDARLYAFGNDKKVVVAQDEGNDNYEVLAVLDLPLLYKGSQPAKDDREKLLEELASWMDTRVMAELVVNHLEEQGDEVTLDSCKEAWLGTLEYLGSGIGIARSSGEATQL